MSGLSLHDEWCMSERAMKLRAMGYVMKQEASNTILSALETVCAGIFICGKMKDINCSAGFGQTGSAC
jgi:DNA-binding NarL/FixJ family response regulator